MVWSLMVKNIICSYQWFPFDAIHGMKHWKHLITKDFQHYQSADDLIPLRAFESHGCYSGGALKVGDKLAMFYTGNTRRPSDNQRDALSKFSNVQS